MDNLKVNAFNMDTGMYETVEIDKDGHEVKKRKLIVYFSNDRRAVFEEGEVEFRTGSSAPWAKEVEDRGGVIVNWDNVCFIRPYDGEL